MATDARPLPEHVAEDAGTYELPFDFDTFTLEELWERREEADAELRVIRDCKSAIDMELMRRFRKEHPGLEDGEAGSQHIVGENIDVTLTWYRDYEVDEAECVAFASCDLLTPSEFSKLVTYYPKVNGTVFNALMKRGGELAERLNRLRKLKGASPRFEARERV